MKKFFIINVFLLSLYGCNNKDYDYSGTYTFNEDSSIAGTIEKNGNYYKFNLPYFDKVSGKRTFRGDGKIENSKIIKDGLEMGFIDEDGNVHINSLLFIKKK